MYCANYSQATAGIAVQTLSRPSAADIVKHTLHSPEEDVPVTRARKLREVIFRNISDGMKGIEPKTGAG